MKGLSECEASESNVRRIQVKDIVKEVKDYLKTYSSAGMDISWHLLFVKLTQLTSDSISSYYSSLVKIDSLISSLLVQRISVIFLIDVLFGTFNWYQSSVDL
ncbi:hypothetical protein Tco_0000279 [Tanacetum coccineum]